VGRLIKWGDWQCRLSPRNALSAPIDFLDSPLGSAQVNPS